MLKIDHFETAGAATSGPVYATIELASDERHLRRKVLTASTGDKVLLELERAISFGQGDILIAETGERVQIIAAVEPLYEVKAKDSLHHAQLCWHLGNRHLAAQIEVERILILRDHVIKDMLLGLGADVREVEERFFPVRGAYHNTTAKGHSHSHAHSHDHSH